MDTKDLYKKSEIDLDRFIKNIKQDQWNTQSTCSEWVVKDLVNHLVYENLWLADLLDGKTVAEVGDQYEEKDLLGDDPKQAWEQSSQKASVSLTGFGDLEKIINLGERQISFSQYLSEMIFDKIIHGWDVAKSTGQADDLDQELVDFVYDYAAQKEEELRSYGVIGKRIEVPKDADKQTKLLAMLGRKR